MCSDIKVGLKLKVFRCQSQDRFQRIKFNVSDNENQPTTTVTPDAAYKDIFNLSLSLVVIFFPRGSNFPHGYYTFYYNEPAESAKFRSAGVWKQTSAGQDVLRSLGTALRAPLSLSEKDEWERALLPVRTWNSATAIASRKFDRVSGKRRSGALLSRTLTHTHTDTVSLFYLHRLAALVGIRGRKHLASFGAIVY